MDGFIKSDYKLEDLEFFRDEKGFIDLSKADIKITSESREKKGTQERLKNWVDFDGKKVLIRGEVVDNYSVYAELIVEEIAKELGIETAHYDLIKIKDEGGKESYGVLSESIIDLDKQQLISLHDLIGDESESVNTTEDVDYESVTRYQFTKDKLRDRLSLSGYSEQDINQILLDYDKRMLFYLSVLDTDKHTENISFVKDINGDGKISLSPNYDSEFSLLLELDRETAEIIAGQPFGIEEEAEVQDPKIGVIVGKEDGGWNEMWKDTLGALIENDEVYNYYYDHIHGKINMGEIFKRVEDRIHAPLPSIVKNMAQRAYYSRNEAMELIVSGELIPKEEDEKEEKLDINSFLSSLIKRGMHEAIRTGEQVNIGKNMERDIIGDITIKEDQSKEIITPNLD